MDGLYYDHLTHTHIYIIYEHAYNIFYGNYYTHLAPSLEPRWCLRNAQNTRRQKDGKVQGIGSDFGGRLDESTVRCLRSVPPND